jgi:leader peptidase (prepilin peptidase) / N-methyltransferase
VSESLVLPRADGRRPSTVIGLFGNQPLVAIAAAAGLAAATVVLVHPLANALAFAAIQVLLVAIAATDLAERRIPNVLVAAVVLISLGCRAVSEPSLLVEISIAGALAFAGALLLANFARGGLGMGDVKLIGALGFLLGSQIFEALLLGTATGAIAAILIMARRGRRATFAYGPYLALGAAVGILLLDAPPLL